MSTNDALRAGHIGSEMSVLDIVGRTPHCTLTRGKQSGSKCVPAYLRTISIEHLRDPKKGSTMGFAIRGVGLSDPPTIETSTVSYSSKFQYARASITPTSLGSSRDSKIDRINVL